MNTQKKVIKALIFPLLTSFLFLFSCQTSAQEQESKESTHNEGSGHDKDRKGHKKESKGHDEDVKSKTLRGEHSRESGAREEGEEDGTQLSKNSTYDVTKHGIHLVLKFDEAKNAFVGKMTNTTNKSIDMARVEVHLSNGTELGPTLPKKIAPKASIEVVLKSTEASFSTWSTHAEVGNLEHGESKENGEGHSERENGEHRGSKKEHN